MFEIEGKEGVEVQGITEIIREISIDESKEMIDRIETERMEQFNTSLAGHILNNYNINKDARRNSGIDKEMKDALRAFNGNYSESDLTKMGEDSSQIFMNITATKCRAAASWIKDIILPSTGRAWEITPSVVEEISPELKEEIETILEEEFSSFQKQQEAEAQPQQGEAPPPASPAGASQQPQQQQKQRPQVTDVASKLAELNQVRRDIKDTIKNEIRLVAKSEMEDMEDMIQDQLQSGNWDKTLADFVDNFVVYPTAFFKGPIVQKKTRRTYVNGEPKEIEDYFFDNEAVNPLDMYPSPDATDINDGTLIQHLRLSRKDLHEMKKIKSASYNESKINEVLENNSGEYFLTWWIDDLEDEKATEEMRGTSSEANRNVLHGIHFYGPASVRMLKDWGYPEEDLQGIDDTEEVEIEAILVENTVIKAVINNDPIGGRKFYKASFQNRPGSFWGRSLPSLMDDIQRMCNATARALSNNMGLASGPQIEIYVDRLADEGAITEIEPFKVWQLDSDPTGAGGRAIQFHQPSSNAAELMSVYKEFELRADDATGIPRYAYGNERTGGAAQTASGLSMLLESASKGIKDAIRHIDNGVIIPRIEYQFYMNILKNPEINYTGDIEVVGKGSAALTMKAAEQSKRMEFLQAISGNPQVLEDVGVEGMDEIFRTMLADMNMGETLIPSRLELKKLAKQREEAASQQQQQAIQMAQEKNQIGLKATETQVNGQMAMHKETIGLKRQELQLKEQASRNSSADRAMEVSARERIASGKNTVDAARASAERAQAERQQRRQLAADFQTVTKDPMDRMRE